MKMWYGVAIGHRPGVYPDWASTAVQVHGYRGAQFKKFKTREEAEAYACDHCTSLCDGARLHFKHAAACVQVVHDNATRCERNATRCERNATSCYGNAVVCTVLTPQGASRYQQEVAALQHVLSHTKGRVRGLAFTVDSPCLCKLKYGTDIQGLAALVQATAATIQLSPEGKQLIHC